MSDQFYLAFDTETGGTDAATTDLFTIYAAILSADDFKVVEDLDLKLKPEGRLPKWEAGAMKVNGIDVDAHLADPQTITYPQGKELLHAMMSKYSKKVGKSLNIRSFGYNVPFDESYVFAHLIPKAEWQKIVHYKGVDVMQWVDFLKLCGWLPPELGSLGTVVDYFGIPKLNAHTAKDDLFMTIGVCKKVLELMKSKKDGGQTQDLIALLEAE